MDFILDDEDTAVVRLVADQLVRNLELDVVAVAGELSHQIGTPHDNARPAREVVEDLVDNVIRDDIEKVLAIDQVA
jgi:hypothetical protein